MSGFEAIVLDPDDPSDAARLRELRDDPATEFLDRSAAQLAELRALRPAAGPELTAEPLRWVHYPWRRTVVAVLGPRAFRAVRLDRNRNLITAREQARLGELTIGVAGLSVGHVIAHTLAAEGLCGTLRLADFDELELSNLNRVPATVFDIGLNKAHAAARRVAELDPYIRLQVHDEGIRIATVDEFLDGLDIVVEECDSLEIKAILREAARARRIPVLMATSDRGLVDVERFDAEPDRPILHGLLGELDTGLLPGMSSREKVPHILRHLEAELLSPRTAASTVEIDRTLSTWPQLAGEVALGATALAEAVRRIGLGEPLNSGRVRIDVGDALNRLAEPAIGLSLPEEVAVAPPDGLAGGVAGDVLAAAIRAPSGGNVQPWSVEAGADGITLRIAREHTSTMDVAFRGSAVALGAAMFNARVAAAARGVLGAVTVTEDEPGTPLQADMRFGAGHDAVLAGLDEQMMVRETNRRHGSPRRIADDVRAALTAAAEREGARLTLLSDPGGVAAAAQVLRASDRVRFLTPHLHTEMVSELRWPGDPSPDTGIDVRSLELDDGDLAVLDILRRSDVMAHLHDWEAGTALGQDTFDRVSASSALGVVSVGGRSLLDYFRGGSAVEAVWITAEQHGLAVQPVSPVFLYAHGSEDYSELSAPFADELADLKSTLVRLAGTPADDSLVLLLRFAGAEPASVRSRRSLVRVAGPPATDELPSPRS